MKALNPKVGLVKFILIDLINYFYMINLLTLKKERFEMTFDPLDLKDVEHLLLFGCKKEDC